MTMNNFRLIIYCGLILSALSCTVENKPPNILFIAVDDLRTELGAYGDEVIHSPHLDKLASEGALFTHHFVQVPTCGASRYALLTGKRPRTKNHLKNDIIAKKKSK